MSPETIVDVQAILDEGFLRLAERWYIYAMITTIDSAGRIVIPKATRSRLGLEAGRVVEIRERDGLLEIEPVATVMALKQRGRGLVAVPEEPLPPLTDAMVRATLEGTRR